MELFELSLHGGVAEGRYRKLRPEIEALDWTSLDTERATEAERGVARQQWTAGSLQEYATAAIHTSTLRLLLEIRAPLDISAMAAAFPLDEIAHAELCARVANALGGGAPVAYQPAQVFAPPEVAATPLETVARRAVRDFCVSETLANALLRAGSRAPGPGLLRKVHELIARDEALHAKMGWLILEWASEQLSDAARTRLARAAEREIALHRAAWKRRIAASDDAWSPWTICGGVGRENYLDIGGSTLARQVIPGLARFGIAVKEG